MEVFANVVNIFSMITLPSKVELTAGVIRDAALERKLLGQLSQKYDPSVSSNPDSALLIRPELVLDHVEYISEKFESMRVHGSIFLTWRDERLKWSAKDEFAGIPFISRQKAKLLLRPYTPPVFFDDTNHDWLNDIGRNPSTFYTITNDGWVTVNTKFSLHSTCNFNFRSFPQDVQKCSLGLFIDDRKQMAYFVAGNEQSLANTRFPEHHGPTDEKEVRIGNFQFDSIKPSFHFLFSDDTHPAQLQKADEKQLADGARPDIHSSVRFTLTFRRAETRYFYEMSIPAFCLIVIACVIAQVDSKHSLFLQALIFVGVILQAESIKGRLPPDDDGYPLIVFVMIQALLNSFVCFILRAITVYFSDVEKVETTIPGTGKQVDVKYWMSVFIPTYAGLQVALAFYLLFVKQSFDPIDEKPWRLVQSSQ